MTPPQFSDHPCIACVLQESRSGRVCPAAHENHGLTDLAETFERQRQAERLRMLIHDEAPDSLSLTELIRAEAQLTQRQSPQLALPAAPHQTISQPQDKEAIHVVSRQTTATTQPD